MFATDEAVNAFCTIGTSQHELGRRVASYLLERRRGRDRLYSHQDSWMLDGSPLVWVDPANVVLDDVIPN
jgi:hypothetical protein